MFSAISDWSKSENWPKSLVFVPALPLEDVLFSTIRRFARSVRAKLFISGNLNFESNVVNLCRLYSGTLSIFASPFNFGMGFTCGVLLVPVVLLAFTRTVCVSSDSDSHQKKKRFPNFLLLTSSVVYCQPQVPFITEKDLATQNQMWLLLAQVFSSFAAQCCQLCDFGVIRCHLGPQRVDWRNPTIHRNQHLQKSNDAWFRYCCSDSAHTLAR